MSNYFYDKRMEIKKIADDNNVDIGVATDMFRVNNKEYTNEELKEWNDMIRKIQLDKNKTLEDLFK